MFVQAQTTTDQNAKYDFIKKMQKIIVDEFCMRSFLYVEGDIAAKNKMFMMTCGTK
jgi:ABC-type transport system substrate-binding protein